MVEGRNLFKNFTKLRDDVLHSLGVKEDIVREIVSARLLIERLGESDANYWWDSRVLSSFGTETLEDVVPRTATRSQIELAMKIGRKAEREAIEERSISLFDLGPYVESQIQRSIDQISGERGLRLLEELTVTFSDTGWSESLSEADDTIQHHGDRVYKLGSTDIETLQRDDALAEIISQLIHGYGAATENRLVVPYFAIEA